MQEQLKPLSAPVAPPAGGDTSPTKAQPTYVEELCNSFRKRDRRGAEVALATVRAAIAHVLEKPTEEKFRRLRGSNARVKREVLAHQEAVILLRLCGFVGDGEDLVLPPAAPLQALRDVLAKMPLAKDAK